MLKRKTKDLPLHPIPLALKWNHLSDLSPIDYDIRTPARIDLLLGVEIFTSIFLDGRCTGPRGMPSAINTCFGWVLFGKNQVSDVVDVANLTLERDVLKDMIGLTRSYRLTLVQMRKGPLLPTMEEQTSD